MIKKAGSSAKTARAEAQAAASKTWSELDKCMCYYVQLWSDGFTDLEQIAQLKCFLRHNSSDELQLPSSSDVASVCLTAVNRF